MRDLSPLKPCRDCFLAQSLPERLNRSTEINIAIPIVMTGSMTIDALKMVQAVTNPVIIRRAHAASK
jgi:hypothetical protein